MRSNTFYCLEWKPPSNTDKFIIARYALQIGNITEWIDRRKTVTIFGVFNKSVSSVTFMALSTCGEKGANVTLPLPHLNSGTSTEYPVTHVLSASATANLFEKYPKSLVVILSFVLLGIIIFFIVAIIKSLLSHRSRT